MIFNKGDEGMIVLSIDIQKGITDNRLYAYESFIRNVTRIISSARTNNVDPGADKFHF